MMLWGKVVSRRRIAAKEGIPNWHFGNACCIALVSLFV
jgi:hypothetical protein